MRRSAGDRRGEAHDLLPAPDPATAPSPRLSDGGTRKSAPASPILPGVRDEAAATTDSTGRHSDPAASIPEKKRAAVVDLP